MQAWMMVFIIILIPYIMDAVEAIVEGSTYVALILSLINRPYDPYDPYDPDPYAPIAISIGGSVLTAAAGIISFIFGITVLIFLSNLRFFIRMRYSLPPDCCCDCCVMCLCLPCAITQMYRHVYASNTGCICSDPGPHPELPNTLPPGTVVTQQVVVTAQPGMVTAQPGVFAAQPGVVTAQPGMVTAQPVVFAAQPTVVTAQPAVFADQPAVFANQPAVFANQPGVVTQQVTVVAP